MARGVRADIFDFISDGLMIFGSMVMGAIGSKTSSWYSMFNIFGLDNTRFDDKLANIFGLIELVWPV